MNIPPFSKTYDGKCVLNFPGLSLEPGKIYCIIGANGSGKSTFAKVLSGTIPADRRGRILTCSVGYMPQKSFAFRMSTRSNLLLKGRDKAKAEELLDRFGLSTLADKRADRLSGGETARMALARLMMGDYDVVILDEPTASMDMEMTLISESAIEHYVRRSGCTLLLVTHSLQQAQRLADEVLFFHRGELIETGPKQLLTAPTREETREFLQFYGNP